MLLLLLSALPSTRDGSTWASEPAPARGTLLAQLQSQKGDSMDRLQIEKLGGFAGYGGPHLKSRGEIALSDLSPSDRQAIEELFRDPGKVAPAPAGQADAHRYKLKRETPAGPKEIEVPEHAVPEVVRGSVRDVLE